MSASDEKTGQEAPRPRTVQDYLTFILAAKGYSPATLAAYGEDLRQFEEYLLRRALTLDEPTKVTREAVRGWLADLHRLRDKKTSMARKLSTLRGYFKYLLRQKIVEKSPLSGISNPKPEKRNPRALNVDQALALVTARPDSDPEAARDLALAELLYGAGLRVSEAVSLNLDDLDLRGGVARVMGKGSKERLAPLGEAARQRLAVYLRHRAAFAPAVPEQAVFLGARGGRLNRRQASRIIEELAKQAGVPSLSPHVLRHSFASHLLQAGADLRGVQELLGHARLSTTQRYTHLNLTQIVNTYDSAHPKSQAGQKPRDLKLEDD